MPARLREWLYVALIATNTLQSYGQAVAQPQATQSAVVKKTLEKATKQVRENLEEFERQNKAPFDEARGVLTDEITKLNKAGKNKEATEVQNVLNTLEATVLKKANAPLPVQPSKEPLPTKLVGKWDRTQWQDLYLFDESGLAESWKKDGTQRVNTGRYKTINNEEAEVAWQSGHIWKMRVVGNDWIAIRETLEGKPTGDGIILERMK